MTEYHAGMIVRQKAIDWWPYIGNVVDRINKAAENMDIEALDETFLDVARLVEKRRKVTTVTDLKKKLERELQGHKHWVKAIVARKRTAKTGVGIRGKRISQQTIKVYQYEAERYSQWLKASKNEIQALVKSIKTFSPHRGKLVVRGNVPLRVFFGGKYPAGLEVEYKQGWERIR